MWGFRDSLGEVRALKNLKVKKLGTAWKVDQIGVRLFLVGQWLLIVVVKFELMFANKKCDITIPLFLQFPGINPCSAVNPIQEEECILAKIYLVF